MIKDFANCGDISIDYPRCIRYTFSKSDCKDCVEVCPTDAISLNPYPLIDTKKCIKCGLCYAVCKFSAFVIAKDDSTLIDELQSSEAEIGCVKSNAQIKVACVSRLTELIIISSLVKHGRITIKTGNCKNCKLNNSLKFFKKSIQKAVILANSLGIKPNIKIKRDPSDKVFIPQETFSRREIFKGIARKIKRDSRPTKREILVKLLSKEIIEADLEYPEVARVEINDECNLCGVCEHICPSDAILIKQEEDKGAMLFNLALCLGCKECEIACIRGAINVKTGKTGDLKDKPKIVYTAKRFVCEKCGKPFYSARETNLCPTCENVMERKKKFIEFLKNI